MDDVSPKTEAALATTGHIYCAGTLVQCLYRWQRLTTEKKAAAFLKIPRAGTSPTVMRGEELDSLAIRVLESERLERKARIRFLKES